MVDGSLIFNAKMDNTQFNKNINSVNKKFSQSSEKIKSILNDTERSAKSKAASIAAEYRKMGQSQTEAMKNAWAQIERNTSDSSAKVKKTTEETGDSFTGMIDDLLNSSDFITMALKLVVSGFKKVGQTAESIANGVWNSSVKIGQGIGYASAEIGKFTLKQFIGDWENQSSGFNKMLMMGASAFSIYRLFSFGREGVELASDLEEVQNVVDVAFTSMSGSVNKWAADAKKSYGLSETMAKKYVGLYGSMSKQFGFTERKAFDMSTTLAGLAGDVASFYNITQDEAYTKLKSVFSGETETLKDIGVVMTQNALDAYALANGYNKTTAEMSEMEKVSLRYNYVVDTLNNVTGDYVRTQHSWANQIRQLQLNCQELQATVGKGAINALTPAITILNVFIEKLQTAAEWFEILMTSIFGDSSESSGGVTEFADGAENAAGAIDSVTDSAKNLNQTLASFDELNVMSDNEKETDIADVQTEILEASGIISETVSNTKDEAEKTLSSIEFAEAVREAVKSGNWYNVGALISKALAGQLENITWDDIQATSVDIAKNIADFINGALSEEEFWQNIGETLGNGFNTAVKFLLTSLEDIEWGNVGVAVGISINELIGTFDAEEYGKLAAERINAIFSFIAGAVNTVKWENLGTEAGEGLLGYFSGLSKGITYTDENGKEVTTTIPQTIANLLNGIVKAGLELFTYKDPETGENIFSVFGTKLGQGLQEFIETFEIKDGVLLAKNIIGAFVKFLYNAFEELDFTELGIEFSDSINEWLSDSEWWSDAGGMINEIADDILDFILAVLYTLDVDSVNSALGSFFDRLDLSEIGDKIGAAIGVTILKSISSAIKDIPIIGRLWTSATAGVLKMNGWDDKAIFNVLGDGVDNNLSGFKSVGEEAAEKLSDGYKDQLKKKHQDMRASTVEATQISISGAKTAVDNDTSIETAFKNKGTDSRNALVNGFDKTATEEHFSDVWRGIQGVFFNVKGWFKRIFGEAWDDVKGIFSDKEGISNIRQSVEDVFKNVLNDFIEGINNAIANPFDSLNNTLNFLRTFEFANQKVFSWIPNIPVPRIPKLATGTVVPASYGEFLAVLGDNKREAEVVSPVSTMKKAFLEALAERGYNGTGGDIYITLTMPDGSVLFRTVVDENNKYKKSNGRSAFA